MHENKIDKCLCCEGDLTRLINFGDMPLVNTYDVKETFPLAVNRCEDCCHLQLSHFVDPTILYSNYAYRSGTGETARDFFAEFARMALSYYPTVKNVLDIACNDGSQLDEFQKLGLATFGIDPASNLCYIASGKNHTIACHFFEDNFGLASYDTIVAQNVLGHTSNPLRFLEKCAQIMHDDSWLFVMTSQANMIVNGECDAIYHEHISYFNAHSMRELVLRAGLTVVDIQMHPIHGTSFLFAIRKNQDQSNDFDRIDWESIVGMQGDDLYDWWVGHVEDKLDRVHEKLQSYRNDGYHMVGLGAAAKGLSMLNMVDFELDAIFDNTPEKWGKMASGTAIHPWHDLKLVPHSLKTCFVILPWNLRSEIRRNAIALRNNPNDVFIDLR